MAFQPASSVLDMLQKGNKRYQQESIQFDHITQEQRMKLCTQQSPLAIILSCSDSRVSPELVFHQACGNLFVVRIAGNIVTPAVIESIEFALLKFCTPLLIVMGHESCGAVTEALYHRQAPHCRSIIQAILPSLKNIQNTQTTDQKSFVKNAIITHTRYAINQLIHLSSCINARFASGELDIRGAYYTIATGSVTFY